MCRNGKGDRTTLATSLSAALLRVEMVLARLTRHKLPVTRDADSFEIGFVSFHVFRVFVYPELVEGILFLSFAGLRDLSR